jgi:hypothetical protein
MPADDIKGISDGEKLDAMAFFLAENGFPAGKLARPRREELEQRRWDQRFQPLDVHPSPVQLSGRRVHVHDSHLRLTATTVSWRPVW